MDPDDDATLARIAGELADAIDEALCDWVVITVGTRAQGLDEAARRAGQRCRQEVGSAVRALLATDIDEQRSTPLQILRDAVRYPTEVLASAGIDAPARDEFARRMDPGDLYGLVPATWSDFGERVAEAGLAWGAAKAHVHMSRHRSN